MRFNMKFCIAAFRGNNSKISPEPQREVARLAVTEGLLETEKSAAKLRVRNVFYAISNIIVITFFI